MVSNGWRNRAGIECGLSFFIDFASVDESSHKYSYFRSGFSRLKYRESARYSKRGQAAWTYLYRRDSSARG